MWKKEGYAVIVMQSKSNFDFASNAVMCFTWNKGIKALNFYMHNVGGRDYAVIVMQSKSNFDFAYNVVCVSRETRVKRAYKTPRTTWERKWVLCGDLQCKANVLFRLCFFLLLSFVSRETNAFDYGREKSWIAHLAVVLLWIISGETYCVWFFRMFHVKQCWRAAKWN